MVTEEMNRNEVYFIGSLMRSPDWLCLRKHLCLNGGRFDDREISVVTAFLWGGIETLVWLVGIEEKANFQYGKKQSTCRESMSSVNYTMFRCLCSTVSFLDHLLSLVSPLWVHRCFVFLFLLLFHVLFHRGVHVYIKWHRFCYRWCRMGATFVAFIKCVVGMCMTLRVCLLCNVTFDVVLREVQVQCMSKRDNVKLYVVASHV